MTNVGNRNEKIEKIRTALRESPLMCLREILKDRQIYDACRACGHNFRERQYGPVATVFHFLMQAIQREDSFAATCQDIWTPLIADIPEVDPENFDCSALTHARKRLPKEVMHMLASQACNETNRSGISDWKGFRLLALDGSTVSMPREAELFEHFGAHRARTTTVRYPLGTTAFLLTVDDCLLLDWNFGPFDPGEDKTSRPLLGKLNPGDLLLADRGFAGSPTLARVRDKGADFLMRKNGRLKVENLPVIEKLGRNDFITEIPMSKPARKLDPSLPEKVRVRIFKAYWKTPAGEKIADWFVTSLIDSGRFKRNTLARLYHRRWRVETSYMEFKQTFHSDVLRSKTVDNIYKEFASHILAYQMVRLLICEAAKKHKKKASEISLLNATRWVLSFSRKMSYAPAWMLPLLYDRLLDSIACSEVDVRPGRLEPRALTREWKHYPHLRTSRAEWRKQRLERIA